MSCIIYNDAIVYNLYIINITYSVYYTFIYTVYIINITYNVYVINYAYNVYIINKKKARKQERRCYLNLLSIIQGYTYRPTCQCVTAGKYPSNAIQSMHRKQL